MVLHAHNHTPVGNLIQCIPTLEDPGSDECRWKFTLAVIRNDFWQSQCGCMIRFCLLCWSVGNKMLHLYSCAMFYYIVWANYPGFSYLLHFIFILHFLCNDLVPDLTCSFTDTALPITILAGTDFTPSYTLFLLSLERQSLGTQGPTPPSLFTAATSVGKLVERVSPIAV